MVPVELGSLRREMKMEVLKLGAKAALRSAVRPPEEWERLGFKMDDDSSRGSTPADGKRVGLTGGPSVPSISLGGGRISPASDGRKSPSDGRKEKGKGGGGLAVSGGSKPDVVKPSVSYATGGTPGDGSRCSTPNDDTVRGSTPKEGAKRSSRGSTPLSEPAVMEEL